MVDTVAAITRQTNIVGTGSYIGNLKYEGYVRLVHPHTIALLHLSTIGIEHIQGTKTYLQCRCGHHLEGKLAVLRHLYLEPVHIVTVIRSVCISQMTMHCYAALQHWAGIPSVIWRRIGLVIRSRKGVMQAEGTARLTVLRVGVHLHLVGSGL